MKRTSIAPAWYVLAAVLVCAGLVRARLLDVPLERDEGEYAYVGQLLLDGVPPYTLAYNMKLPGIYAAYAAILALFGQTHKAIHLGLLLVNAATTVLVFALARRWLEPPGAVAAAAAFALLSIGQPVQGIFANAEHFVLPFALGGLFLATDPARTGPARTLAAGALLGIAVLVKQHGAAFAAAGLVFVAVRAPRRALWLGVGAAIPYAATCLLLAATGAFSRFWFWTVEYARAYASQMPLEYAYAAFLSSALPIFHASPGLWLLAAAGLAAVWLDPGLRPHAWRISLFAGLSFAAICPGLFFREHYFVLLLPAAGLLAGAAVQCAARLVPRRGTIVAAALVALACGDALVRQKEFLFEMDAREASRSTYGVNPFPESLEIARYIREHASPDDRIAILGSEPQILFYAQRRSVTPYIYTYALMEQHDYALKMQRDMIADIESARPRFMVYVRVSTSWLQRPESHTDLFEWFAPYQEQHYRVVGVAEIVSTDETRYYWDADVFWPPRTGQWVALMERKSTP